MLLSKKISSFLSDLSFSKSKTDEVTYFCISLYERLDAYLCFRSECCEIRLLQQFSRVTLAFVALSQVWLLKRGASMQPPAEAEVPAPPATVVVVAMHVWEGLRTPEIVKIKHTCESRRERNKKKNTYIQIKEIRITLKMLEQG